VLVELLSNLSVSYRKFSKCPCILTEGSVDFEAARLEKVISNFQYAMCAGKINHTRIPSPTWLPEIPK
jgi:hypothetical protein